MGVSLWGFKSPLRHFYNIMKIDEIIKILGLKKHPEGGYYRETYRSKETINKECLPEKYSDKRNLKTVIYYFLTKNDFSEMHRLKSDEIYHFYYGDFAEVLLLYSNGEGEKIILGNDLKAGIYPQLIVPSGVWQGIRVVRGGKFGFSLIGTTVSPGFEFDDYERGDRKKLISEYPKFKEIIIELTRK